MTGLFCAELDPDGGVTDQVYFATRYESEEFVTFMNGDTKGVGMSALWYWYEPEFTITTLEKAKRKFRERKRK